MLSFNQFFSCICANTLWQGLARTGCQFADFSLRQFGGFSHLILYIFRLFQWYFFSMILKGFNIWIQLKKLIFMENNAEKCWSCTFKGLVEEISLFVWNGFKCVAILIFSPWIVEYEKVFPPEKAFCKFRELINNILYIHIYKNIKI